MISLFQSFPRFDKSSKWIVILLVALLAGQIVVMLAFGEKGRNAMKNRVERTSANIIKNSEVYKTEAEREHRVFRSIKLHEFVSSCSWYSAAFGSIVVSILLLSFRWWGAKIRPASKSFSFPPWRLVFWIFGISLIALTLRLPRMELGLYNDEAFNFTRYIHGQFKDDAESGKPKFHKHHWQQTLWGNSAANNGALFSILARASHDIWQKTTGAVDGEVSEFALRIPSLLAGVAGISVIGLLAYVCLGARASVIAALLTALHPWHLRYSTEARAYAIVMLLAATILLTLILAIREGRWRWWFLFGGAQVLCLWAYTGSVYFLIPVNLVALVWMIKSERDRIPRWVVANAIGAVCCLQIIAPSLPQISYFLSISGALKGFTGMSDSIEILAYLLSGMPLVDNSPANPWSPAWQNIGISGTVFFFLITAFFLFGFLRLLVTQNVNASFVAVAGVASVVFAIIVSNISGGVLHHWYLLYALPSFIFVMAATVDRLWEARFRLVSSTCLLGIIAAYAFPFIAYSKQSKEPLRPLTVHIYGEVYPFAESSDLPLLAAFWSDIIYNPDIVHTPTIADLKKAIERAKNEKRPLFVEFGYRDLALQHNTELVEFIENSGKFEFIKTFHGLEESQFSHHLFRLK